MFNIVDSRFFKNIAILLSGTGGAQALSLLAVPLLTRLYMPGDFGIYGLYVSTVSILGVVSGLRYEQAILLPKLESDAVHVLFLDLIVISLFTVMIYLVLIIGHNYLFQFFKIAQLKRWIIFIPLSSALVSGQLALSNFLIRHKQFKKVSIARIAQVILMLSVSIFLGFSGYSKDGLIWGWISGYIVLNAILFVETYGMRKKIVVKLRLSQLKEMFVRFKEYPKFNTFHAFIGTLSSNLPIFVLNTYFGAATTGFYTLTLRVVQRPLGLASGSITQAFNERISELYRQKKELQPFVKQLMQILSLIVLIPFIIILVFAPQLFSFIFGKGWIESGIYAQILSPWIFLLFIVSTFSYIPMLFFEQKKALIIEVVYLILRISALVVGFIIGNIYVALSLFSLSGVIVLTHNLFWYYGLAKKGSEK